MRWYTLVEEHAADPTFGCEHGLSFYLETAVSYTHLDVYKRQIIRTPRSILSIPRAMLTSLVRSSVS